MSGGEAAVESFETFVLILDKDTWTSVRVSTLYTPSLSLNLTVKVLEVNE